MVVSTQKEMVEVTIHGRGGQGAITASSLLCALAFEEGYKDVLDIPKIGAERRGAPVQAFSKISKEKEIKDYTGVLDPDYTIIFDYTLLEIPLIASSIKGITLVNANDYVKLDALENINEIWIVDATNISIQHDLLISGYPILNTLMLGAFAKVSGLYTLETMKKVFMKKFAKKGEKNFLAAKEAYESVKKVKG
ncbi:MAG: 2-oxoacid:acceptor oxidoreductase family protein [Promethearchaeota archaeon]